MLQLLLVRTGATEYDTQGRVQGTLDVPLSEDGRRQIEQVADELRDQSIVALYAGPSRATTQTVEILAERLKLKSKTVENLRNLDHGLWQGMLIEDVKQRQPKVYRQWLEQPETVCPPEGESLQAVRDRLRAVLAKIAKKQKTGLVALVVCEPATSVLRNLLRDVELGNLWQVDYDKQPAWELLELPQTVATP